MTFAMKEWRSTFWKSSCFEELKTNLPKEWVNPVMALAAQAMVRQTAMILDGL